MMSTVTVLEFIYFFFMFLSLLQERHVSLKKSHLPGRMPLNSLNDGQSIERKCPSSVAVIAKPAVKTDPKSNIFSPR